MITLKQAIKLLNLRDGDFVYICKKHCQSFAPYYTVKQMREKLDFKKIKVKNIYPYHFMCSDGFDWEFVIEEAEDLKK